MCGEKAWAGAGMVVTLIPEIDPNAERPKTMGLAALPLVCGHCGYIRLHSTRLLEKKLNAEGAAPNGQS
jgi:hypothetical protein